MSDQQAPAQQDTPAVAGPDQAPGTQDQQLDHVDPYEKRYNDLRPQFDRVAAERAQLEQDRQWYELALTTTDEDTRRQALQHLGYDVPEDEDVEPAEYEWDEEDPFADLQREIAELRAWKEQTTEQEREAHAA